MYKVLLMICGVFYSVLCVFSIVTGLMYASGKKKLNPLELTDKFLKSLNTKKKMKEFTVKMGWITFIVGIIQGITAYSLFKMGSPVYYFIAIFFTEFSIVSAGTKLKMKFNMFPLIKVICYLLIMIVLLLPGSIHLFF